MNAGRLFRLILTGAVASLLVLPAAQAGRSDLVQIDGKFVAPAQVSAAQVAAGKAPSTRLMQIGGYLVEPSQSSSWQSRAGAPVGGPSVDDNSSFVESAGAIATAAAVGTIVLLASAAFVLRRRRAPATV
jgi:hypothetical protein